MVLDPKKIPTRDKLILTGLFLSKYNSVGLKRLGFETFKEAFNIIGYGLCQKPASIKNYRDEFDPLLSNTRRGWHKRPRREYCLKILKEYQRLDVSTFASLIQSFVGYDENLLSMERLPRKKTDGGAQFVKRLVTGLAAGNYFEAVQKTLTEFRECSVENTTRLGCGYDFRVSPAPPAKFFVVEVKGLAERSGSISMTPKEFDVASTLENRFFLFVVKNFREVPYHEMYQNPLNTGLRFERKERLTRHVSWLATI
jgi:hypothetical protein